MITMQKDFPRISLARSQGAADLFLEIISAHSKQALTILIAISDKRLAWKRFGLGFGYARLSKTANTNNKSCDNSYNL